jgi:hypothetical protein
MFPKSKIHYVNGYQNLTHKPIKARQTHSVALKIIEVILMPLTKAIHNDKITILASGE